MTRGRRKRPAAQALARERATDERITKAGADGHEADITGRQRMVDAPLDRLSRQGFITQREFDAGDRYRTDAYLASIDPAGPTIDWNRTSGGTGVRVPSMFSAQHVADARIRLRKLDDIIPRNSVVSRLLFMGLAKEQSFGEMGRSLFGIRDAREAVVAGRVALRMALAALADATT